MLRTHPLSDKDACIIAVAALDDLVNDLVKASCLHMSPAFLDWVADEATPLVESQVARFFNSPRFAGSLLMGDPRIALARWVRHWVCPHIVARFSALAVYLPEFAQSRPVPQLPLQAAPVAAPSPRPRQRWVSGPSHTGFGQRGLGAPGF
ncbi:hypothetical protein [Polaromonas sp. A23]|uniref:hypothetical protein n=1 Tax=Polaromonas sp. A23 TaxID=1944133 RepID=UPI001115749D|nr:hypothetical protein [Polaromonas sp. A23]